MRVKSFQDVVDLARKIFFDSVPSPRPEHPTYQEALAFFPGEDWGDQGDFILCKEVFVEDLESTYCIWSGCFWDPDEENDRFVGVWVNEKTPLTDEVPDPATSWEAWIGWNYRWEQDMDPTFDEPRCVGFVEE